MNKQLQKATGRNAKPINREVVRQAMKDYPTDSIHQLHMKTKLSWNVVRLHKEAIEGGE